MRFERPWSARLSGRARCSEEFFIMRKVAARAPGKSPGKGGRLHQPKAANEIRVVLYSPGIAGLGHMRRNLLLGQALACSRLRTVTLLVAEARQACAFAMPSGMDCLTLPALQKQP